MVTAEHLRKGSLADYLSLAKPRVVLLHMLAATSAMFLAAGGTPPAATLFVTLIGGGLVAAAANALNCYFDRNLDARMARTRRRPLPSGRIAPAQALLFAMTASFTGLLILSHMVNTAAAVLSALALLYYVVVYTCWLKPRTAWSAVIGSGAGALTPLVGWVAISEYIGAGGLLLSGIIFLWTVPHFWALALLRRKEYELARVDVPAPGVAARGITVCAFGMVAASLALAPAAGMGLLYLSAASLLGTVFLHLATNLQHGGAHRVIRRLYACSILYLLLLFIAIPADRLLGFYWSPGI